MSLRTKIIKQLISVPMAGWSKGSIETQRARQVRQTKFMPLPANVQYQPVAANGVSAEWVAMPDADLGVMLYLHGGAYALGSIKSHRGLIARLAHITRMRVLAIDYRLAPEHPYPAALEDALTAYHWLVNKELGPPGDHTNKSPSIIIAGDSAGGGLALATLVALREAGKPLPSGLVCLSPWTDLALTGVSVKSKAKVDPILDAGSLEKYAQYYAGKRDRTTPKISPLYADLKGLPPLLIQVGTDEILLDDAVRLTDKAQQAGVDVTLEIWDEMFHVFQMFSFLTETKEAMEHIAAFVSERQ
ncbi:MAG: alpha/beta hydrolase [Anaerolineae bacterium]|nr:alpha/beta hydrolase [Anaerolineae bacterium]